MLSSLVDFGMIIIVSAQRGVNKIQFFLESVSNMFCETDDGAEILIDAGSILSMV